MIAVGICTKNCEKTIRNVIEVVDSGLKKLPGKNLIIVSDGFSGDRTRDIAENTETMAKKIVTEQYGEKGKGNGVKTIFEIAKDKASGVILVDGDLLSIKPKWIEKLGKPILEGRDLVVPFYLRSKYDGVITNHLIYPLTKTLFGVDVRQPIGGEYGLSKRFVDILLNHRLFPEKFGIDIFITIVAACEDMDIVEAVLGVKEHESTKEYKDPSKLLIPMFYQVMGTMFDLIDYYKDRIKDEIREIPRIGSIEEKEIPKISVDKENLLSNFKKEYKEGIKTNKFLKKSKPFGDQIDNLYFPEDKWADLVFKAIKMKDLDGLRILWQGRYAYFVREVENKTEKEAEEIIEKQIEYFMKYKYRCKLFNNREIEN